MRVPILVHDFAEVLPRFLLTQAEAFGWLAGAHHRFDPAADPRTLEKSARRFGCDPSRVAIRHVELGDFVERDPARMRLFGDAGSDGVSRRMDVFSAFAQRAFLHWYPEGGGCRPPRDLLHVTCTGYVAPSAAQLRVAELNAGGATRVTHLYHMGCYAALPALRVASGAVADGAGEADVAHTEACSLHFDPRDHSPEQWVIQSLFADGAIRYRLTAGEGRRGERGYRLLCVREEILPQSSAQMGWQVSEGGFRMSLAREVPETIGLAIRGFFERLCADADLPPEFLRRVGVFAIHPGGPRIIDRVVEALGLREESAARSRELLRERGNLSSATLPTLWARLLDAPEVGPGTPVASFAFGPGLTACGAIMVRSG